MQQNEYTGWNRFLKSDSVQQLLRRLDDGTFSEFIDDWKWIFSFSKQYRWVIVLYTAVGILSSTLSLGSAWVGRLLINIVVGQQREKLLLLIGAMLGMTAVSLLLSSVGSRIFTRVSIYVNNEIQAEIFDRILDAGWPELSRYSSGDLLNRFNNDVGTVTANAINWIPNLIINIYTFVITFAVLFRMDAVMAWIAVLSAPFLLAMSRRIMRRQKEYRKRVLELNSGMMSFETETFYHFDIVKAFGITGWYSRRLRRWQRKYKDYNLDYNLFSIKTRILLTLVSTLVGMAAFGYCLYRLWTGQILYGDMAFFLQQRSALSGRFNGLVGTIPGMLNSAVSAHRIRELTELKREAHDPAAAETLAGAAEDGLTLRLEGIRFSYPGSTELCSGLSLEAKPGEIIALLSPSGGGKTTLMRLLLGMLNPDEGSVTLTGADGKPVPMNADLRQFFAYVPQGNTVFSGTVADNLRMVREGTADEELIDALKASCAWDFVEQLPGGLYAELGEGGRGISEGQAQRIAIARALVREAPVLLLDEATAALDADTEEQVLRNILCADPKKTVLLATHRPGALKLCKRIYRLEQGKLTELSPTGAEELARRYAAFSAFTPKQPEPDHVPVPEAVPAPAFAGFAPEQTQEGWWPL